MRSTLDPTLDVVFKLLLAAPGCEEALLSLLNAVLRPKKRFTSVRVLNPEVLPEVVKDKSIILDLLVAVDDGPQLNVEMQAHKRPSLPERALYYWAGAFRSQLKAGALYSALRPVVSVLFLDYVERGGERLHSTFRLLEVEDHLPLTDAIELHLIELPKRLKRGPRNEDHELVAWSCFLGAKSDKEAEEACMGHPAIEKAYEQLKRLSANPEVRELVLARQRALDTHRIEMGGAREAGLAAGRKEGMKRGLERGLEQGLEQGRSKELRAGILALSEVLGIRVTDTRRAQLARMSLADLGALRDRLRRSHRW